MFIPFPFHEDFVEKKSLSWCSWRSWRSERHCPATPPPLKSPRRKTPSPATARTWGQAAGCLRCRAWSTGDCHTASKVSWRWRQWVDPNLLYHLGARSLFSYLQVGKQQKHLPGLKFYFFTGPEMDTYCNLCQKHTMLWMKGTWIHKWNNAVIIHVCFKYMSISWNS